MMTVTLPAYAIVPAGAMPQLFDPFFSLKAGGTRLGLAIAKPTVDAHGGCMEAVSSPGAGMMFFNELRLSNEREGCAR